MGDKIELKLEKLTKAKLVSNVLLKDQIIESNNKTKESMSCTIGELKKHNKELLNERIDFEQTIDGLKTLNKILSHRNTLYKLRIAHEIAAKINIETTLDLGLQD